MKLKFWERRASAGKPALPPCVRSGYVNAAGRDLVDYLTEDDAKSAVIAIKSSGRAAFCLDKIIDYHKDYDLINSFAIRDLEKTLDDLTPASSAIISAVVRWLRCLPV